MELKITDKPEHKRYQMKLDGNWALAHYRDRDGVRYIEHVEVAPAIQHRGAASALMRGIVNDAKERGINLVPVCSYAVAWLQRHPNILDA